MLLPLSVLYFKKGDLDKAADYLRRLAAVNKDTKKFIRGVKNGRLDKYAEEMSPYGYQPFTIQELIMEMVENKAFFSSVPAFFYWADKQLIKKS